MPDHLTNKHSALSNIIFFGLLLFLFFEYFNPGAFIPPLKVTRVNTFVPLVTLLLWIFYQPKIFSQYKQSYILIGFTFLTFLSVLYAFVQIYAFEKFRAVLGYVIIYLIFVDIVSDFKRFNTVLWTLIAIHFGLILININAVLFGRSQIQYITGGYFLGDGNDFSLSLIILIPLVLFMIKNEKRMLFKFVQLIILAAFLISIIFLESRGSFLALLAILFYIWIKSKKKLVSFLLVSFFALLYFIIASESYFQRMETILEYSEDNSANTRILAWKSGLQIFIENPFGVGAGNFPSVFGRFYNQEFLETVDWGGGRWISPHSMYIQCLTELGFIGIGLLFYLFIINFKLLSNLSKKVLDRNLMNNIVHKITICCCGIVL